jgi:hypothetical protein
MRSSRFLIGRRLAVCALAAIPLGAQSGPALEALGRRLDQLERQNAELQEQVRILRRELDQIRPAPASEHLAELEERAQIQEGRLAEHDQIKLETTHRVPVRLTGMALFNAFSNSRHGGTSDNPTVASATAGPVNAGGTFRQSVIGLEFNGPEAVAGGHLRGSFLLDLFSGSGEALNQQVRLRTASIEGQWRTWGFLAGQEKPILAPREPNSLAQVGLSPLTAAGNLWRWRPQVRAEKRFDLGAGSSVRARLGVSQTDERYAPFSAPQYDLPAEARRPALEGHFQFTHQIDEFRRLEFAPGFHWSTSHVGGFSVPANAFSLDWFVNPHRRIEFAGAFFRGRNLAKLGGGGVRQGFTVFRRNDVFQVIPVRTWGGWGQLTFIATPRWSFNVYGGQDDPNDRDLTPTGASRNRALAGNVFYRLAPNVVIGAEVSQVRTSYVSGFRPHNNHYNLAVAYLF